LNRRLPPSRKYEEEDYMKKLIAIAVVFALVSGVAFAVDLGGTVIGTVNVLKGDSGKDASGDATKVTSDAGLDRIRIDGGGEAGDGKFGGYFRLDGKHWSGTPQFGGNAWWKPIDQFKLLIGNNGGDGFYGKDGITQWMFYQTVTDTGVAMGGDNSWGDSLYGSNFKINTRDAFYGGDGGGDALRLEIKPIDILGINISLPFFDGGETGDVFSKLVAQVDLNFDFGNIALTYKGGLGYNKDKSIDDPGSIFLYYGGSFGDLNLDFGLGYKFANHYKASDAPVISGDKKDGDDKANPIGIGLGLKYSADAFGIKFRTVLSLPGTDSDPFKVLADVLPYYTIADNVTVFGSIGLGIRAPSESEKDNASKAGATAPESVTGWHFNPYIQIGEEWGAKFLAGFKLWSDGQKTGPKKDEAAIVNWAVPIALIVSF